MQQLQVRENCIQLQYAQRWKFGMALHNGVGSDLPISLTTPVK